MSVDDRMGRHREWRRALFWLGAHFSELGLWCAALAILVIVVLNTINIVMRYFFFSSLSWGEEAMQYVMVFGVYVGAISVAWQRAHIRIDILLNAVPPSWRRTVDTIGTLVVAAILIPVIVASYHVVMQLRMLGERSDALHVPIWIPQFVIPTCLLLIVVMSLLRILSPEIPHGDAGNDQSSET